MPPPPINWRTRPNPNQRRQDGSQPGAATDAAVPIYVTPARLHQIEAALRFLNLPPLSYTEVQSSRLSSSDLTTSSSRLSTSDLTSSSELSLSDLTTSSQLSDLMASFSQLSMSRSSVQTPTARLQVRRTPAIRSDPSPRKDLKKYYVVTVGKCTGIFWEEW